MREIGAMTDLLGRVIQLALYSKRPLDFSYDVFIRRQGTPWTKQKGILVSSSTQARAWAEKQFGGQKIF